MVRCHRCDKRAEVKVILAGGAGYAHTCWGHAHQLRRERGDDFVAFRRLAKAESGARPHVGLVLAYDARGRLLLGRRRDNGRWTLPGGHLEPGEGPTAGARRELLEETGLRAAALTPVPMPDNPPSLPVLHVFSGTVAGHPHNGLDPDAEVSEWAWHDVSEGLAPAVHDALHGPVGDLNVVRRVHPRGAPEQMSKAEPLASPAARIVQAHPHAYPWHHGHHQLDQVPDVVSLVKDDEGGQAHAANAQANVAGTSKVYHQIASGYGKVAPGTTPNLKFWPGLEHKHAEVNQLVAQHGYTPYYAGGKHGKADLAGRNYTTKHLMIWDPSSGSGGDFGHERYTDAWRKIHELGHAETLPDVNKLYGEGGRMGRLGRHRTLREALRSVHWEHLALHRQRQLAHEAGVHISDEDFAREHNTIMHDAVHRAITGKFTEPADEGFHPDATPRPVEHSLNLVRQAAGQMGLQGEDSLMGKAEPETSALPAESRRFVQHGVLIKDDSVPEGEHNLRSINHHVGAPPALRDHVLFAPGTVGLISGESPRAPSAPGGHDALKQDLQAMGLHHEETVGSYGGPERSFLVHGPTQEQMMSLGHKYGQESVVWGQGGRHRLIYTTGPNAGQYHPSLPRVRHSAEPPEDFYTTLPGNNGHVSLYFNFDKMLSSSQEPKVGKRESPYVHPGDEHLAPRPVKHGLLISGRKLGRVWQDPLEVLGKAIAAISPGKKIAPDRPLAPRSVLAKIPDDWKPFHEAHDYSHLLPQGAKPGLRVEVHHTGYHDAEGAPHKETLRARLVDPSNTDDSIDGHRGVGVVGYVVANVTPAVKKSPFSVLRPAPASIEPHSHLTDEYQGKGLGSALYEALYAHARNVRGISHVLGGIHSDDADKVHRRLAAKHGFDYRSERDPDLGGQDYPWGPYHYTLKAEPAPGPDDETALFGSPSALEFVRHAGDRAEGAGDRGAAVLLAHPHPAERFLGVRAGDLSPADHLTALLDDDPTVRAEARARPLSGYLLRLAAAARVGRDGRHPGPQVQELLGHPAAGPAHAALAEAAATAGGRDGAADALAPAGELRALMEGEAFEPVGKAEELGKVQPTPVFPKLGLPDDRRETPITDTPGATRVAFRAQQAAMARYAQQNGDPDVAHRIRQGGDLEPTDAVAQGAVSAAPGSKASFALGPGERDRRGHHDMIGSSPQAVTATKLHEDVHQMFQRLRDAYGRNEADTIARHLVETMPDEARHHLERFMIHKTGQGKEHPRYHEEALASMMNYLNNPTHRDVFNYAAKHTPEQSRAVDQAIKQGYRHVRTVAAAMLPSKVRMLHNERLRRQGEEANRRYREHLAGAQKSEPLEKMAVIHDDPHRPATVYRVEGPDRKGPHIAAPEPVEEAAFDNAGEPQPSPHQDFDQKDLTQTGFALNPPRLPDTATDDEAAANYHSWQNQLGDSDQHLFAFERPEHAVEWFGQPALDTMAQHGYHLKPVQAQKVWRSQSGKQVIYLPHRGMK